MQHRGWMSACVCRYIYIYIYISFGPGVDPQGVSPNMLVNGGNTAGYVDMERTDMHALRFVHVCRYGRKTMSTGEQTIGKAEGNEAAFTNMIGKAVGNEAACAICTVYAATDELRKSVSSSPSCIDFTAC